VSNFTFGQEWVHYEFTFDFSDIKSKEECENINFKYIDGVRTDVNTIIFNNKKKQFNIRYLTMGGGPILVLEKDTKKMYILLEGNTGTPIFSEFKEGFFKPNGSNLIEIEIDKYIEWINNNELKELKLSFIENK